MNIGNTHTQYAEAVGGVLGEVNVTPTADLQEELFAADLPLAVASVVPSATAKLVSRKPFLVSAAARTQLKWDRVDTSTLGADRIANAIYLGAAYPLPAVCVDCGTAITFEAVDADHNFIGGAIAPGRMLLRRSLNAYTAQLPLLAMSDTVPAAVGGNTLEAMRLGIDGGAVGMVRELMRIIGGSFGGPITFVAVGGDAEFFVRHIEGLVSGGADFTLRGILASWEMAHEG